MNARCFSAFLLFAMSAPALAQYAQPATGLPGEPAISPERGQDPEQMSRDRYECYGWAKRPERLRSGSAWQRTQTRIGGPSRPV